MVGSNDENDRGVKCRTAWIGAEMMTGPSKYILLPCNGTPGQFKKLTAPTSKTILLREVSCVKYIIAYNRIIKIIIV